MRALNLTKTEIQRDPFLKTNEWGVDRNEIQQEDRLGFYGSGCLDRKKS